MNHIYECPTARSNACHPSAALINTARVDIGRPPRRAGRGNGLVGPSSASAHGKPAPGFSWTRTGDVFKVRHPLKRANHFRAPDRTHLPQARPGILIARVILRARTLPVLYATRYNHAWTRSRCQWRLHHPSSVPPASFFQCPIIASFPLRSNTCPSSCWRAGARQGTPTPTLAALHSTGSSMLSAAKRSVRVRK